MEMLGTLDGLQEAAAYRLLRNVLHWTALAPLLTGALLMVLGLRYKETPGAGPARRRGAAGAGGLDSVRCQA